MVRSALLSWTLTVVFIATAAYYVWRSLRPVGGRRPTTPDRVSSAVHIGMSVGMIPMLWWWGMSLPALPQAVVFGLGAVWFLVLAASGSRVASCMLHDCKGARLINVHHVVLMVAMVWMVALMSVPALQASPASAAPAAPAAAVSTADHAVEHDMGSMAGMDHSVDHAMDMGAAGTGAMGRAGAGPSVAVAVSLALVAYFLLLIPWWIYEMVLASRSVGGLVRVQTRPGAKPVGRGRRARQRAVALEAAVHAAKCGGMGVMLLAML
jgi:hypothetical protein